MNETSLERFEAEIAAMPDVSENAGDSEVLATPKSDLEKASEVFGMVEKLDGDSDAHMADLVRSANEFATAHPESNEASGEAKIADTAGAFKILEGGDVDDTARTLGEQPTGLLDEALSEIATADSSGEAVKEIKEAIDRHTLATTTRVKVDILAKLQPGFAKEQRFVTSAAHAESHGEKGATSNNERIISTHISRLEALSEKVGLKKIFASAVKELVITPEDIPERYYQTQAEILRDNGQGGFDLNNEKTRGAEVEAVRDAQGTGLESWSTLLQQDKYPTWFKFYAWDGMSRLSTFNYDKGAYNKRSSGTTAPYPRVNGEALDIIFQQIQSQVGEGIRPDDTVLAQSIDGGNFNKVYSHALLEVKAMVPTPESTEKARNGDWMEYGPSEVEAVMSASEGTPWCVAGEEAATMYLARPESKFYMYHMKDEVDGIVSSTACASVRMEGGVVAEVSGIAGGSRQVLEPSLAPIVLEKVQGLPGGERFLQAYDDKEKLMSMDKKMKSGEDFTIEELKTLYEIDRKIQYSIPDEKQINDPRPAEFKAKRARHIEQLREAYGNDAEWLTEDTLTVAREVGNLLNSGADANLLSHKLDIGPTWHPQSKYMDAALVNDRFEINRKYVENLDLFVKKGLRKEIVQRLFDERQYVTLPSIARASLEAGLDAETVFKKVLGSPDKNGITYDCIEEFATRGVDPNDIATAVISNWGEMHTVTKYPDSRPGADLFDFSDDTKPTEENPIQRLVAIGTDMTQFAEQLSSNNLAKHRKELTGLGVDVDGILSNSAHTQEAAREPEREAAPTIGGWTQLGERS